MLRIFQRGDHQVSVATEGGVSEVTLLFPS